MTSSTENNVYDIYTRSQQQILGQWQEALAGFQKALGTSDASQTGSENTHQAFKAYDSWKEGAGKYLDVLMSACPGNAGTDTFARLFRAADAYAKLYEFWEPLAAALQEKAIDPESCKGLVDPAKYAETINRVFGFGSPATAPGLWGNASELIETWAAKGQQWLKPWADAMRTSVDASLAAPSGDPEAAVEAFRSLHAAFEDTFGKALNMPAVGKDREQVELLSRTIDRYTEFVAKNAELQRHMGTIAGQAMEKVVQNIAQKVKDGEEIKGFGQFVQIWTKTNEEAFLEFFRTDQFAQLQGIALETAVEFRSQFQRLLELSLKDLPIALRSEMDDVCKTSYTLNKRVRALGKKCSEIDGLHDEIKRLKKKVTALEKKLAAAAPFESTAQTEVKASG